MSNENNKMQVDIENLFKQNVNDLSAIKELYRKLKEVEEKISQIKYIDSNLANKLKKDYEKLKRIIMDENVQATLSNEIETVKTQLTNDIETIEEQLTNDIESIETQLTNNIETIETQITNDIETINSQLDKIVHFVNDENSLKKAIKLSRVGGVIQLINDVDITEQIIIDKDITFDGCGYKLKCVTNGLNDWIKIITNKIEIKNTSFDDNLKGRVIIATNNTNDVKISNCYFTGYTKDYGYYKTDGIIRVDYGAKNVIIDSCMFEDCGYQYNHESEELNRAITLNDNSIETVIIKNSIFRRVNQGIVSVAKSLLVDGCLFDYTKDNSIYTSGEMLKVVNCDFKHQQDEPIVSSSLINNISNNTFNEYNNKCICFAGSINNAIVINNTFVNISGSQCLGFRDGLKAKTINFSNNTVLTASSENYTYPIITMETVENMIFNNNYIETSQEANSSILRLACNIFTFIGNTIKQLGEEYPVTVARLLNESTITNINCNHFEGCRLGIELTAFGKEIEPKSMNLVSNTTSGIFFCSQAPTYFLPKGTIVFNNNYSGGKPAFWISMGDQWVGQKPEIAE